jgi:dTDP-4-dehydrorhamnose reductase
VKLLRRIRSGESLSVVDDQLGCPTAASELARAMREVGVRLLADDRAATGLFNFRGGSEMTWHGFAQKVVAASAAAGLPPPPLRAIRSADLNAPARRPAYSVLSCARIERACGIVGAEIEEDIERMVRAILAA